MSKDITDIFREIRNLREAVNQYCLAPGKIPVSLDDLSLAILQYYEVKLAFFLVPLKSELWKGHVEIWDLPKESPVYINAHLNKAETRFTAAKEMAQVIIANAENRTEDAVKLIEEMVIEAQGPPAGKQQPAVSEAFIAEAMAYYVAIELLFPFELRDEAKRQIDDGETTLYKMAESLEIPDHVVGRALTDWYHDLASGIWSDISD
jgi:hypothetical protein